MLFFDAMILRPDEVMRTGIIQPGLPASPSIVADQFQAMSSSPVPPNVIMRTGVIQPSPNPGDDAVAQAAAKFLGVGNFPNADAPETIAGALATMAAAMRIGTTFSPTYYPLSWIQSAQMLAAGQAITVTSQGRTVTVAPSHSGQAVTISRGP